MKLIVGSAFLISVLASGIASAHSNTSLTLTSDYKGTIIFTADNVHGLKPKDFLTDGLAGENESFLDVCYRGDVKDVEEILNAVVKNTDHWKLGETSIYRPYSVDGKWAKSTFVNREKSQTVGVIVHPCR